MNKNKLYSLFNWKIDTDNGEVYYCSDTVIYDKTKCKINDLTVAYIPNRKLDIKGKAKYYSEDDSNIRTCYDYIKKTKSGYSSKSYSGSNIFFKDAHEPIIVYGSNENTLKSLLLEKEQEIFKEDLKNALNKILEPILKNDDVAAITSSHIFEKKLKYISFKNGVQYIDLDIRAMDKSPLLKLYSLIEIIFTEYINENDLDVSIPMYINDEMCYVNKNIKVHLCGKPNTKMTISFKIKNTVYSAPIVRGNSGIGIHISNVIKFKSIPNFSKLLDDIYKYEFEKRLSYDIIILKRNIDKFPSAGVTACYKKLPPNKQNNHYLANIINKNLEEYEEISKITQEINLCEIKLHSIPGSIYIKNIDILFDAVRIKNNRLYVNDDYTENLALLRQLFNSLDDGEHSVLINDLKGIINNSDEYDSWLLLNEIL